MSKKKYKFYTAEEKLEYLKLILEGEYSQQEIARQNNMSVGMLSTWMKKYREGGLQALENKRKPGNPLSKYQRRKKLTPMEELEYENMKLRIENERLKKGYSKEEVVRIKNKK